MLGQQRDDDRRVLRTLALVDGGCVGGNQHVEFAESIGDRPAVEGCRDLARIGIDLPDVTDVAVIDLLVIVVLDRSQVTVESRETPRRVNDFGRDIVVSATEIEVCVPFEGPSDAFGIQPSTHIIGLPRAAIVGNMVTFCVDAHGRNNQQVKAEIDRTLGQIEQELSSLRNDVSRFLPEVPRLAREWIVRRRSKFLADQNLVSSLGYKLKERSGVPRTYAPPEVRRKITPTLPPRSTTPFKPEPALTDDDYNHILKILHDMAIVMERSPSAFKDLDEEALRFLFLVPLNGHYEGASGEVFNYEGKTDILIRVEDRTIFIAECKFWGGPKNLTETIDQLLRYLSWRDTKTAIIIFNKNKNFSKVLEAIPPTVVAHSNFLRSISNPSQTSFRYVFSHRDDPNREFTLTILAFDVPST
jgi:hypothetical protein